ncbi:helix-turn-helix domain-containing protein [Natronorarus salvus]|uniref:helix-turn-helix domain-containing protein n=1 Tax=Natronorarus salvus TaxID=3117733 RepID=UPI002F2608C8
MATIAEFTLPVDGFVLDETIQEGSIAEIEVERVAAHGSDYVMSYSWLTAEDFDRMNRLLEADSSIDSFELLSTTDSDTRLYRMGWGERIELLIQIMTERNSAILSAVASEGEWHFRVLFPEREALSRVAESAEELDAHLEVITTYSMDDEHEGRFGLSDSQYELLELATERGYYDVPREVTLEELAEEFESTHQSLSERLRRAEKTLNVNTVLLGEFE